jgi:uncharacterized membrane protein YcaP (DUF421 family)
MDTVIHAAGIYLALMILLRMSGRRTLAQATTFDLILLLVISEATQQALLGDDFSLTTALLVIVTLIGLDIAFSFLKIYVPSVNHLLEGQPMIIVEHGRPLRQRMRTARVDEHDVLEAARKLRGLEAMSQIKYAILEVSGGITVIPFDERPRAETMENEYGASPRTDDRSPSARREGP